MAENAYPFAGVQTNEDQFTDWAQAVADGGRGSGVLQGCAVTAGSGMAVNVAAGVALVAGRFYENTATKSVAITAAPASGTRKDYVVLRVTFATKTIQAVVKAGTTANGGTLPALQQDDTIFEHPLATVTVASGTLSITSGMVASVVQSADIAVFPYATTQQRPTPPAGRIAVGLNTTTKTLELWDGAAWSATKIAYADVTGTPTTPPAHTLDSHDGTLALAKGGTGATTAAAARTNLGAAAATHTHTRAEISDAGAQGRVVLGGADLTAVREAVGIRVTSTPMTAGTPVGTIRIW